MLVLEGLTKRFGAATAVSDLSLEVASGEFVTLLGPSGCGKTTTLRMIAGFESPTSGRILLHGRDITSLPPQRREIGMVFQSYALFPHLDVYENVAFGLKARRVERSAIQARVARALELVDLAGFERRRVQELSGGQQQRVAVARALAPEPPVLLLDEPLSNLDAALRERTRGELRALLKRLGITTIFVTHDQEEAFALSDRIAVMNAGRLEQVGSPESLYLTPATPFVASFLGKANFVPAWVERADGARLACRLPGGAVWPAVLAGASSERVPALAAAAANRNDAAGDVASSAPGVATQADHPDAIAPGQGDSVQLMVRPEALRLAGPGENAVADDGVVEARVLDRRFAGATTLYRLAAGEFELLAWGKPDAAEPGDPVMVRLAPDAVAYAFPAETARRG